MRSIIILLIATTCLLQAKITRAPYLQLASNNAIHIVWRTDTPTTAENHVFDDGDGDTKGDGAYQKSPGLNRQAEAETTLHSALSEIVPRLNPKRPDPILLANQGIAYALLGQKPEAKHCLKLLQQYHAPDWIMVRLQEAIAPK